MNYQIFFENFKTRPGINCQCDCGGDCGDCACNEENEEDINSKL